MIQRYRKKPVEIEAVECTGSGDNRAEIIEWTATSATPAYEHDGTLLIKTLEGEFTVSVGDFVIKGVQGEFYPCKPDIFHKSYDWVGA
jgi:hypothetical protein